MNKMLLNVLEEETSERAYFLKLFDEDLLYEVDLDKLEIWERDENLRIFEGDKLLAYLWPQ